MASWFQAKLKQAEGLLDAVDKSVSRTVGTLGTNDLDNNGARDSQFQPSFEHRQRNYTSSRATSSLPNNDSFVMVSGTNGGTSSSLNFPSPPPISSNPMPAISFSSSSPSSSSSSYTFPNSLIFPSANRAESAVSPNDFSGDVVRRPQSHLTKEDVGDPSLFLPHSTSTHPSSNAPHSSLLPLSSTGGNMTGNGDDDKDASSSEFSTTGFVQLKSGPFGDDGNVGVGVGVGVGGDGGGVVFIDRRGEEEDLEPPARVGEGTG
eukprot:CAMPEP_0175083194 /NCGR_PEP_ID=MMETSP0052_2-20121109/27212_1 /TAXON_ID=51329 ORGANISM="Polytomella parva, Strain SAG 63-3" /NCGR_SAMPLE_ID=MMETSP0052_2 /ASSEMBLY_ACC=CAM_ASM_000194 /LENGTH=261 /DNA_ID=CAMNT_0016354547 /DNA_START=124 /DNA_END=905 /DNA_ORIENTATION=-